MTKNASYYDNLLAHGDLNSIFPRIHEVKRLFGVEEPFLVKDIPGPDDKNTKIVQFLSIHGALIKTRERKVSQDGDNRYRYEWRFRENVKEALEEYWEELDKLPCGHRSHIYNHPTQDGYSCKYCDDWPQYDRKTIEKCL